MIHRVFLPTDVRIGVGSRHQLPEILRAGGYRKALLLSDAGVLAAGLLEDVRANLPIAHALLTDIEPEPTAETIARLRPAAAEAAPDVLVAVGGGSVIDVAKVLALLLTNEGTLSEYQWGTRPVAQPPLPLVALPTTAGTGAEVSRAAVLADRGQKQGVARDELFPRYALVDPELTRTLPPHLTAWTAADALAHALEALVARQANPVSEVLAVEAACTIITHLRRAYRDGQDMEARLKLSQAATMAGMAMAMAGLGVIHAIASPLGARFPIHHGLSNALLLPFALRFNAPVVAPAYARLARRLGLEGEDAELAEGLRTLVEDLLRDVGVVFSLTPFGVRPADTAAIAEAAASNWMARSNPRPVAPEDVREMLHALLPED